MFHTKVDVDYPYCCFEPIGLHSMLYLDLLRSVPAFLKARLWINILVKTNIIFEVLQVFGRPLCDERKLITEY
jgi:hypothetical protein